MSKSYAPPKKSLRWPPGDSVHVFCHASSVVMMFISREACWLTGTSKPASQAISGISDDT